MKLTELEKITNALFDNLHFVVDIFENWAKYSIFYLMLLPIFYIIIKLLISIFTNNKKDIIKYLLLCCIVLVIYNIFDTLNYFK